MYIDDESIELDSALLNLFGLLSSLGVVGEYYDEYNFDWNSRQHYIYRHLIAIAM